MDSLCLVFVRVPFFFQNDSLRCLKCFQGHAMYSTSVFCFHFIIKYKLGQVSKKIALFFGLCRSLLARNSFYSYFSICWLDFFPNIRFSNRSDFILPIKLSLSPRVIWSFLVVRIACFTWKTFLSLDCCFTSFSSLTPYINGSLN